MTSTHRTHGTPKHPPIGSLPLWGRAGVGAATNLFLFTYT